MSQEQTKENSLPNKSASDSLEEKLNSENVSSDSTEPINSQDIESLPIESIGSYARLEELLTDEKSENTSNLSSKNES